MYRVQFVLPGEPSRTLRFESETSLEAGQWVTVDGIFLIVERVVAGKRGDPYDGLVLCKPAFG